MDEEAMAMKQHGTMLNRDKRRSNPRFYLLIEKENRRLLPEKAFF